MIEELIGLAKDMREAGRYSEVLGVSGEEGGVPRRAYGHDRAVKVLGDEAFMTIARELVATIRKNVAINWTHPGQHPRTASRACEAHPPQYGYPQGKQEKATQTVLEQAEVLSQEWAVIWRRGLPKVQSPSFCAGRADLSRYAERALRVSQVR